MPTYLFRAEDGTELEAYYSRDAVPTLGSWTEIDGVRYERVIAPAQIADSKGQTNYRLHSNALPGLRTIQFQEAQARHYGLPMPVKAKRYDAEGRPVFRSEKELQDYCARDGRYKVGNPKEVVQECARKPVEHKAQQLKEVKQREADMKRPVVN